MTPKQERFCREYLLDFNAKQAAIRAGYSEKTAGNIGHETLNKPEVAAFIQAHQAKDAEKLGVTRDAVVAELAKIGFSNMLNFMTVGSDGLPRTDFSGLNRDNAAALQELTIDEYTDGKGEDAREVRKVKFKLADKRSALVDLGKHLGMWKDDPTQTALTVSFLIEGLEPKGE